MFSIICITLISLVVWLKSLNLSLTILQNECNYIISEQMFWNAYKLK